MGFLNYINLQKVGTTGIPDTETFEKCRPILADTDVENSQNKTLKVIFPGGGT